MLYHYFKNTSLRGSYTPTLFALDSASWGILGLDSLVGVDGGDVVGGVAWVEEDGTLVVGGEAA